MHANEPVAPATWPQTLVGVCVLLTGLALGAGAVSIPSEAGYGGVGPNFLPWVVAAVLAVCGAWMIWEARTGGFRDMQDAPGGTAHWVFAGGMNYLDESGDVAIDIAKADAVVTVRGYSGIYDAAAHGATGSVTGVDADGAAAGGTLKY